MTDTPAVPIDAQTLAAIKERYAVTDETIGLALHTELREALDAHMAAIGRLYVWVTGGEGSK